MITIFHVSDLHFGCEDPAALAWFKAAVDAERPDAIALTGDLTMRAKSGEFSRSSEWVRGLGPPVTVEIGNHDLSYYNPFERFLWPYRRWNRIERLIERELNLPGVSLISLKTAARAQWRLDWSKGYVTDAALEKTLSQIAALPPDQLIIVCCHHPLVEANTRGQALTKNGERALTELARANVAAVLSGHVHDSFDLIHPTPAGPIRMIGAGTLSKRLRSSPPSFNELTIANGRISLCVRNLENLPNEAMQIEDVPEDASDPKPGESVAPAKPVARAKDPEGATD